MSEGCNIKRLYHVSIHVTRLSETSSALELGGFEPDVSRASGELLAVRRRRGQCFSTAPESDVRSATRCGPGGRSRPARGVTGQWREDGGEGFKRGES
jgi:hypothetical protein